MSRPRLHLKALTYLLKKCTCAALFGVHPRFNSLCRGINEGHRPLNFFGDVQSRPQAQACRFRRLRGARRGCAKMLSTDSWCLPASLRQTRPRGVSLTLVHSTVILDSTFSQTKTVLVASRSLKVPARRSRLDIFPPGTNFVQLFVSLIANTSPSLLYFPNIRRPSIASTYMVSAATSSLASS